MIMRRLVSTIDPKLSKFEPSVADSTQVDDLDGLRSLLDDPETGMLAHLQLEETADYFLVPQISWHMRSSIQERLSSIGKLVLETYPREASKLESEIRRLGESKPLLDLLPQSERAILFQAIDYAFL